ncbi:MAG: sigma-E processing peptidase SpoIIGA [Clostridia bacterium]|nr:sigma-E processing peptidase SpoIIGA [Clostridia bacterium]
MSVYLDVAFLINFLFDAEIIILTLKIASKKIAYLRVVFAAFVGGMAGVFVFFPYFRILALPPISFSVLALMLYIAGNLKSKKDFFEIYIIFLINAFLFGGIMTFLRLKATFGLLVILPVYHAVSGI